MTDERITDLAEIEMTPGISLFTNEPFVQFRCSDDKGNVMTATMPVPDARQHALGMLEAAEAAEQDHMLWRFFTEKMEIPEQVLGQLIGDLRIYRIEPKGEEPT